MLCINKRLYRSDRPHGSNGSYRTGGSGSAVPVSIFYAAAGGNHRNGSDP